MSLIVDVVDTFHKKNSKSKKMYNFLRNWVIRAREVVISTFAISMELVNCTFVGTKTISSIEKFILVFLRLFQILFSDLTTTY